LRELFANRIGGFFGMDVLVSDFLRLARRQTAGRTASVAADCGDTDRWSVSRLPVVPLLARKSAGGLGS
jgi:hypothetical protein